ncbi:hypothetical protein FH972_021025 [Carpinus fangiana]|uniref:Histidine-specific methyltransferase SAM-dependent domain-containing protein n=1 Tax=Carpinus fangiana TaxID=176857 RepID=A0A5N6KNI3_9ROSI|nr:hypothetical protein FH972_021025 [Carpinus fangiana]
MQADALHHQVRDAMFAILDHTPSTTDTRLRGVVARELENLDSTLPFSPDSQCLLIRSGEFVVHAASLLAAIASNLASGRHVAGYTESILQEMDEANDFSDMTSLDQMHAKHVYLKSLAATLDEAARTVRHTWEHRLQYVSTPTLHGGTEFFSQWAHQPGQSNVPPHSALLPQGSHDPSLNLGTPETFGSGSPCISETVHELLDTLTARGTGTYHCPYNAGCLKGGVDDQGSLVLFVRNSAFRYLNKPLAILKDIVVECPLVGDRCVTCDLVGHMKHGYARLLGLVLLASPPPIRQTAISFVLTLPHGKIECGIAGDLHREEILEKRGAQNAVPPIRHMKDEIMPEATVCSSAYQAEDDASRPANVHSTMRLEMQSKSETPIPVDSKSWSIQAQRRSSPASSQTYSEPGELTWSTTAASVSSASEQVSNRHRLQHPETRPLESIGSSYDDNGMHCHVIPMTRCELQISLYDDKADKELELSHMGGWIRGTNISLPHDVDGSRICQGNKGQKYGGRRKHCHLVHARGVLATLSPVHIPNKRLRSPDTLLILLGSSPVPLLLPVTNMETIELETKAFQSYFRGEPRQHIVVRGMVDTKTTAPDLDLALLTNGSISDIGGSRIHLSLKTLIYDQLFHSRPDHRVLPSSLLSDDEGLRLWHKINRMPDYYQTSDEVELLEMYGEEIARKIDPNTAMIDLGCGLEKLKVPVLYLALDLSHPVLEECMAQLSTQSFEHVRFAGLWGLFDDILAWATRDLALNANVSPPAPPRLFMSLGSVLGNDYLHRSIPHLARWKAGMRPGVDRMLLAVDATDSPSTLWASYHDPAGLFKRFITNGMVHLNRVLGCEWYKPEDWSVDGMIIDDPIVMHCFVFRALRDIHGEPTGVVLPKGTEINCYEAMKYGPPVMEEQFEAVGMTELGRWKAPNTPICKLIFLPLKILWALSLTSSRNRRVPRRSLYF